MLGQIHLAHATGSDLLKEVVLAEQPRRGTLLAGPQDRTDPDSGTDRQGEQEAAAPKYQSAKS